MSGSLGNPLSYLTSLLNQSGISSGSTFSPWSYNPDLFPQGLFTNGQGSWMTPFNQNWTGGGGWTNALTPDPKTGAIGQLPSWAGAANPLEAAKQWAGNNQALMDPRMQMDFVANTFGMPAQAWMQGTWGAPQPGGGTG